MATATRIQGNPRLIKRFLNMLTIRMTIAREHGVTVDEGIVTKMLLLERCAPPKAFSDIATAVMKSVDGRAAVLQSYEEAVKSGKGASSRLGMTRFYRSGSHCRPHSGIRTCAGYCTSVGNTPR